MRRRKMAEAPRPISRGPSWEAPVLRIHCKYAVILARRRLQTGRRQGRPNRPRGFLGGGPHAAPSPPGRPGQNPGGQEKSLDVDLRSFDMFTAHCKYAGIMASHFRSGHRTPYFTVDYMSAFRDCAERHDGSNARSRLL